LKILSASPHLEGSTDFLTKILERKLNIEKIIFLRKYKILYCDGCNVCAVQGKCIKYDDDFHHIISHISNEKFILLFPIYFGTVPAILKAFLDRFQVFFSTKNKLVNTESFLIAIKGRSHIRSDSIFLPLEYAFKTAGINILNKILINGIEKREDIMDILDKNFFLSFLQGIRKWDFLK